jgi:hypothetical protein
LPHGCVCFQCEWCCHAHHSPPPQAWRAAAHRLAANVAGTCTLPGCCLPFCPVAMCAQVLTLKPRGGKSQRTGRGLAHTRICVYASARCLHNGSPVVRPQGCEAPAPARARHARAQSERCPLHTSLETCSSKGCRQHTRAHAHALAHTCRAVHVCVCALQLQVCQHADICPRSLPRHATTAAARSPGPQCWPCVHRRSTCPKTGGPTRAKTHSRLGCSSRR